MYSGLDTVGLPELAQMEEMLISPIHALVQLWHSSPHYSIQMVGQVWYWTAQIEVLVSSLTMLTLQSFSVCKWDVSASKGSC